MSGVTIAGPPTAATRMSASQRVSRADRACASDRSSRSRSPAAADAPSACRRCRCGRSTTARAPSSSTSCSRSIAITPSGVAGTRVGPTEEELARVERVEPVDVLRRRDRARSRASSMWSGSGNWTRIASISSSALSSATFASRSSSEVSAGRRTSRASKPASSRRLVLQPDVDLGRRIVADEHGDETDVTDRASPARPPPRGSAPRSACP